MVPDTYRTETFGPITVQYTLGENHCNRPTAESQDVPSWARDDYNDDLPEHLDKIVTLGYWIDPVCRAPILGCMDPLALNYNAAAEVDDGSCQYPPPPVPGCTDPNAVNYNPDATENDGSCEYPPEVVPGCTDPNALNYNEEATVDNGSCEYPPPPEVCQYNPELTADDPECQAPPPEVCQYNTQIPADDPACQPPPPQYHPPEEPATGPEGALPIAEGIAFLAFSGLGAFGIRRMKK